MGNAKRLILTITIIALIIIGAIVGFALLPPETPESSTDEVAIQEIELSGTVSSRDTEVSGLTWYGEQLIILPQYADVLYSINRADILAYLDGDTTPIQATVIDVVLDGNLSIRGFQGYEAIVFAENTAYLTIEANNNGTMASYLISGTMGETILTLDANTVISIPQPANVDNKGHESMILYNNLPMPLYEWNRYSENNTSSFAILFEPAPREIAFPVIPYRMTDATSVDENGRFWVINYHFPDNTERVPDYPFENPMSQGTHALYEHIESIIELQIQDDGSISWLDKAPLLLVLEAEPRNWEGLARLPERNGFLLMTDKFPNTQLVFVELPANQ